jgi:hypothetical protein
VSGRTWLRVEGSIVRHPKVVLLASYYGVHPYLVCGFLLAWWDRSTEFASAGRPAPVSADTLASLAQPVLQGSDKVIVPTITDGLKRAGLMDEDGNPNDWEEYTGSLLTKRAKDAQRKRLAREATKAISGEVSGGRPGDVVGTSARKSRVENKQKDIGTYTGKKQPTPLSPEDVRAAWKNLGNDRSELGRTA